MAQEKSSGARRKPAKRCFIAANEFLPFPLPEGEDYETVGDLLGVIYGSIPEVGDVAVLDPYEFSILARAGRVVELVQFRVTGSFGADEGDPAGPVVGL